PPRSPRFPYTTLFRSRGVFLRGRGRRRWRRVAGVPRSAPPVAVARQTRSVLGRPERRLGCILPCSAAAVAHPALRPVAGWGGHPHVRGTERSTAWDHR